MRPVEYIPELAAEAAAVVTTKLTIDAAPARPARENIMTNGDSFPAKRRQGMTVRITRSAPM
ncbi:hypothetical protein ATCCBAA256_12710 [Mycobacterium montefiorense]|nr:hypothetical protein ATCCBAA256_12710 [Mycobacterium montefiorense]